MKITDVRVAEFNRPIHLFPGDTVKVTHTVRAGPGIVEEHVKSIQDIECNATWTHTILFKLDGHLNHLIGDQATVDWVKGQCDQEDVLYE
jgi:hypothetical protein